MPSHNNLCLMFSTIIQINDDFIFRIPQTQGYSVIALSFEMEPLATQQQLNFTNFQMQ